MKNGNRDRCINGHQETIKTHHALAFQELQLQIAAINDSQGQGSLKERIEVLACIVQLIAFEVCYGPADLFVDIYECNVS